MQEKRIDMRFNTKGHAHVFCIENDLLLKNLSITGCCLESKETTDTIKPNEIYKIEIKPESGAHIGKFEIQAECKWVRHKETFDEIGFRVVDSPEGKFFQNYVDYIDYHTKA